MSLADELKDMAHDEDRFAKMQESFDQVEVDLDKTGKTFMKAGAMVVAGGVIMSLVYYGAIIFGIALAVRWVLS